MLAVSWVTALSRSVSVSVSDRLGACEEKIQCLSRAERAKGAFPSVEKWARGKSEPA